MYKDYMCTYNDLTCWKIMLLWNGVKTMRVLQDIRAAVSTLRCPLEQTVQFSAPQSRVVKEPAAGTTIPSIREALENRYNLGT